MANEKKVKGVVIPRHDYEANWLRAVNFIPTKGEIIIYQKEADINGNLLEGAILPENRSVPYTYDRIKIGDGEILVNELPFTVLGATMDGVSYVVEEEGKSSEWTYKKWSSGKCELVRLIDLSDEEKTSGQKTIYTPFKVTSCTSYISSDNGVNINGITITVGESKNTIKLTYPENIGKLSIRLEGLWK